MALAVALSSNPLTCRMDLAAWEAGTWEEAGLEADSEAEWEWGLAGLEAQGPQCALLLLLLLRRVLLTLFPRVLVLLLLPLLRRNRSATTLGAAL